MKKSFSTESEEEQTTDVRGDQHYQTQINEFHQLRLIPERLKFTTWLKSLSKEQRYLAIQIKHPEQVKKIKNSYAKIQQLETQNLWKLPSSNNKTKALPKNIRFLIESMVFLSDDSHLDSIGFDLNLIESPEKIYDILVPKNVSATSPPKNLQSSFEALTSKEEWGEETIKFLRIHIMNNLNKEWDPKQLENEKNKKREYSFYWKNLPEPQKMKLLFLGLGGLNELMTKLKEQSIHLDPFEVKDEINDLMKLDKNDFCNKIFKCKLKKSISNVCGYHELIYNLWKEQVQKKKKKDIKKTNFRKKKARKSRKKSLDAYSNETNQTQHQHQKILKKRQLTKDKIEANILQSYSLICQEVQSIHQRRQLAFERIQALFGLYNTPIKLFGSCANMIAIKDSDIDIAVDESILSYFQHIESLALRHFCALEYLHEFFSRIPFITKNKLIKTSKIPIIKLTIDTCIPVLEDCFSEQYRDHLNRQIENGGIINIDLTIETSNHLGIISTKAITHWLAEMPTIRPIIVLLKNYLAKYSLNENYNRGLSTYSLILMIVGYVYHTEIATQATGSIFEKMLRFYGWQFDETKYRIDIRDRNNIFQLKVKEGNCAELEVCDPLNNGYITTRNCYRFNEIKEIFQSIYREGVEKMNQTIPLTENYLVKELC